MKKLIILGASGMAGHVMAEYVGRQPGYQLLGFDRSPIQKDVIPLEATHFDHVEGVLSDQRPDFVINCIGMLVQASQDRVDQAILINSYLPHFLSRMGRKYNYRLIHISTDCVFSGERGGYAEEDFRDGDTAYARTKALGEIINDIDLTLRTSIIGPELKRDGTGLLHWFLMQKGEIKGYTKAFWSGVTTLELAKVVHHCIEREVTGLVNLTMVPKISKFDLLLECQKVWKHREINILADDGHACDKSLISRRNDLTIPLTPTYSAMLDELRIFMNQHRDWYVHYPT